MAEERADLRQAERERIARRETRAPDIGRLDVFGREQPAVDRRQNLALDRQRAPAAPRRSALRPAARSRWMTNAFGALKTGRSRTKT